MPKPTDPSLIRTAKNGMDLSAKNVLSAPTSNLMEPVLLLILFVVNSTPSMEPAQNAMTLLNSVAQLASSQWLMLPTLTPTVLNSKEKSVRNAPKIITSETKVFVLLSILFAMDMIL